MITVQHVLNEKGRKVHYVASGSHVLDALRLMAEHNVGAVVVSDEGHLSGIFTERDYARKIILLGRTSLDTPVSEVMSKRVICTRPDQTVEECLAIMTVRSVRHLPVLDRKTVVGIVSIGDLVKAVIADKEFVIEQLEHFIEGDR